MIGRLAFASTRSYSRNPSTRRPKAVGLFLDASLLVLWVVGNVNPRRIEGFKGISKYSIGDFILLSDFVGRYSVMRTAPHVLAEAGNLTDLKGDERRMARLCLKDWIGTALEF